MKRNIFFILAIITNLISCTANRVLQNERMLFPEANIGKWWIVNSITKDELGKAVHFSALISMEPASGNNYASCFISVFRESDQRFYSNIKLNADPLIKLKKSFPLKLSVPQNDTTYSDWNWILKRSKIILQTRTSNKKDLQSPVFMDAAYSFAKQHPFDLSKLNEAPGIWALDPLATDLGLSGKIKANGPGQLFIRVFTDRNLLLGEAKNTFVHWLDLRLRSGKKLSVLYFTDLAGKVKIETAMTWNGKEKILSPTGIEIVSTPGNYAGEKLSKPYPLFFSIRMAGEDVRLLLRPKKIPQEIVANKSSFWMGAVELVNEQTGQREGDGNMYIFRQ